MPRVSVLLTCYNHLDYLGPCLDSLRSQTFRDFEVIALDDGSTDGTREFLAKQADLRVHLNESNLGTYGTLNVGLGLATGDWIAVFNDDDLWAPEKLQRQIEALEGWPRTGLVHTSGWFIGPDGNRLSDPEPLGFPWPKTKSGDVLADLMHHNQIITSSALFSREAVERVGQFDPSFYGCGDWQMWLRIASEFDVVHVDEPLTFYRVHETNAARNEDRMNDDSRRIREWLATWEAISPESERAGIPEAVAHNWACLGTERAWNGEMRAARAAYARAIKLRPGRPQTYLRWLAAWGPRNWFRRLR